MVGNEQHFSDVVSNTLHDHQGISPFVKSDCNIDVKNEFIFFKYIWLVNVNMMMMNTNMIWSILLCPLNWTNYFCFSLIPPCMNNISLKKRELIKQIKSFYLMNNIEIFDRVDGGPCSLWIWTDSCKNSAIPYIQRDLNNFVWSQKSDKWPSCTIIDLWMLVIGHMS